MARLTKAQVYALNQVRNDLMGFRTILRNSLVCEPGSDIIKNAELIHDLLGPNIDRMYRVVNQEEPPMPYGDTTFLGITGKVPDRGAIVKRLTLLG